MAQPMVLTRTAPRKTGSVGARFAESARACGIRTSDGELREWFEGCCRANLFSVDRIPLSGLREWREHPRTGNLVHETGRFFTVEGLSARTGPGPDDGWMQPIIHQPEIGVLGIVVKEFDGVLHLLMQAKMEPGNVGLVQLSPTVQATRSNYIGVHNGRGITHLEYFAEPGRARVLVDVLQSEQGSWFLHKRNRNMIVEALDDVPEHPDFRWLTLAQVHELLRQDNIVNMDARSVLSCIPFEGGGDPCDWDEYREALRLGLCDDVPTRHSDADNLLWLTDVKARAELHQRLVPLRSVRGWHRDEDAFRHDQGRFFEVMAVNVRAGNREVGAWTQPLIAPTSQGVVAFLARPVDGVLHLLVQAKVEAGVRDVAELAPTYQALPSNFAGLPAHRRPRFEDEALNAPATARRYDTAQSEEGGRFHHAINHYRVIDVGAGFPLDEPPGFRWMTPRQLMSLLSHSYYVNVQARSLLTCLQTTL
jgi:oxidase EvaA